MLLCTVLGTITVGGASPGTGHERRLLAALLVWRRTVVSADRLTDVLWPDGAPRSATNTLQSKISRLRRLVGPGRLIRVGSGYVLELPEHGCDADRFTDLVAGSDGLEPLPRLAILDEALGLWTGRAYDDFADEEFARPTASGLEQRRLAAEEKRLEARLALGHYDEVISAAEELIVEDPFREPFWAAEMEALHRSGRSVDALRCYTRARDRFIDETGLPPSTRLSAIEEAILLDERAPEPAARSTGWQHLADAGIELSGPGSPADPGSGRHLDPDIDREPDRSPEPAWGQDAADGGTLPEVGLDSLAADAAADADDLNEAIRRRDSLRARPFDQEIRPSLLVGRAGSRQTIDRAIDRLGDGKPQLVAVVGDGGVGKTRLVEGAGRRARALGWRVLSGRAVTEVAVPLGPIGQLMSAVGISRPAPAMLGRDAASPADAAADMAVVRLVERLADEPTVVVLDDLHWSDRQTASAIELLVAEAESRARTEAVPLLIIVAHRRLDSAEPGHAAIDRLHRHPSAQLIDLRPLDEAGVAAMVESMTGLRPSGAAAARLTELTDGIPLVVGNVMEHWRGQEQLLVRSGCLDIADQARAVAPIDLEGDLRARWAKAGTALTDVLIVLAACPVAQLLAPAQVAGLLGDVLDLDVGRVWAILDEGAELGLLASAGPLGFASPRIPTFVADHASRERQVQVLRRLVTEMIEQPRLERDLTLAEAIPSLAVAGLLRAEEAGVAEAGGWLGPWAVRAAEESLAIGDWSAAARHLTTAIDRRDDETGMTQLADGTPVDLALGLASFRANDESWAQRILLDVAERAERSGDEEAEGVALSVANRIAFAFDGASDLPAPPDQARVLLEGYIDRAQDGNAGLAAKAAALLAEQAADLEDFDRAELWVDRARSIAANSEVETGAEIGFAAGLTAMASLEVNRADREFQASSERALAAGDAWVATWGAGRRILTRMLAGDLDGADRAVQRALDLQIPVRLWSELALTRSLEACLAAARGRIDRAESVIEEAEGLVVRSGYGAGRLTASPARAYLSGITGDHDRARVAIDELEAAIGRRSWSWRVLVDLAAGETDRAADLAASRLARLPRQPTFNRLPAILAVAAAGAATGRSDLVTATAPLLAWLDERGIRRIPNWPIPLDDLAAANVTGP